MRLALSDAEDDSRPSIAVLPFLDMSPDGDQEYFSDGITEEILNTLVKIRDLKVAARTSAFAFKASDLTAEQLGDTLRVRFLVEGSVRKAGDQLRITAQLIDAEDGSHLWSEQYDRSLDDVFAIQTEIAEAIAEELRVPLGLGEDERLVSPTEDLEAYDVYLAGRARMKERGESLREAIRLFEAAIARDSTWAPGWAGLAEALELIGWDSNDAAWVEVPTDPAARRAITNEFWRRSEQAARRAIELDPDNASAHVALGIILRNHRQWEASEAAYLQALAGDPDNAEAYQQYSQLLFYVGRLAEAVQVGRRAVALDRAPVRLMILGMVLQGAGLDDEALEVVEEGIRLDPEGPLAGSLSGFKPVILWGSRRFEDLGDMARESGQPPALVDQVIDALQSGNLDGLPPELRAELQQNPFLPMVLEHHDQAAEQLLESARTDPLRALQMIWMPLFDPIRGHPAYLETLRVLDLEGVTPDRPER
jgi:TolB-like protein